MKAGGVQILRQGFRVVHTIFGWDLKWSHDNEFDRKSQFVRLEHFSLKDFVKRTLYEISPIQDTSNARSLG